MHKKIRKTLLITTIITASLALFGCGGKDKEEDLTPEVDVILYDKESGEKVELEGDEISETTGNLSAEETVYTFARAIQSKSYESAYALLDVPDSEFVTQEDFVWSIPRSSLSVLTTDASEITAVDTRDTDNYTARTYSVEFGEEDVSIAVVLNDENEWKIAYDDFYIADWQVQISKGMPLSINGTEVDSIYVTSTETGYDTYTIPAVTIRELTLSSSCKDFGNFEAKVTPEADTRCRFECVINAEDTEMLLTEAKDLLNNMVSGFSAEAGESYLTPFISDDAETITVSNIHDSLVTGLNNGKHNSIKITKLYPADKEDTVNAVLYGGEDIILLNFRYEKTWVTGGNFAETEVAKGYSSIALQKTATGYKIYELTDTDENILNVKDDIVEWS